jgi:DNA invertase Pin-like site-specific DNA recombinase
MPDLPFSAGSRLVAYLRDSGGRDQNLSVPQQQEAVGKWCLDNGYILTRVFVDVARSGTKTTGRDSFIQMVSYLEEDAHEAGIILWEYSRFSRDFDDSMYYIADLRRQGFVVYSITDNIPDSLDGRLIESITAWKNAKYSEDLRKNVRRGLHYIASVHHAKPGGKPPLGYQMVPIEIGVRRDGSAHIVHRLELDPGVAPLVQKAFEMRSIGATYKEIHEATHLFKWLVAYGKMLQKRLYTGSFEYGGMEVRDFCPPLVDQATWQKVQNVNRDRAERYGYDHPRRLRSRFILTGLLKCDLCGGFMYGRVSRHRHYRPYDYYRCQNKEGGRSTCNATYIPKEEIEDRVLAVVHNRILNSVLLTKIYTKVRSQAAAGQDEQTMLIQQADAELVDAKRRIQRLVAAISDAGHSRALLAELADLEKKQAELIERLARLEEERDRVQQELSIDMDHAVQDIAMGLKIADDKEKAILLRGFIKEIGAHRVRCSSTQPAELVGQIKYRLPVVGTGSFVVDL